MRVPMWWAPLVGGKFGGGTSARILAAIGSMQPAGMWFPGKGLPAPTQSPTLSTIGKKPVHGEDDEQPGLTISALMLYLVAVASEKSPIRSSAVGTFA